MKEDKCPDCGSILIKDKDLPQPDEIDYDFELILCEKCEQIFTRSFVNGEVEK